MTAESVDEDGAAARPADVLANELRARIEASSDPAIAGAFPLGRIMALLCYFSYDEPPSGITGDVRALVVTPFGGDAEWRCVWGPALDASGGNLVYVAGLFATADPGTSPEPAAVAVVTRGTVETPFWATLEDLYEDLTPIPQVMPAWSSGDGQRIANGTADALFVATKLVASGLTVRDYLATYLAAAPGPRIVFVTGHSLGGCVTTALAPWISAEFADAAPLVVPYTFAAPTAGNRAFAEAFARAYPYRRCYANTLDCVPLAWSDLAKIDGLYAPAYPTPLVAEAWIAGTDVALLAAPYARIDPGATPALVGSPIAITDPEPGLEFAQQALAQHRCANYLQLLGVDPPYAFAPHASPMQRLERSQAP